LDGTRNTIEAIPLMKNRLFEHSSMPHEALAFPQTQACRAAFTTITDRGNFTIFFRLAACAARFGRQWPAVRGAANYN